MNVEQTIQECAQKFLNALSDGETSFNAYKEAVIEDEAKEMDVAANGVVMGYFLALGRSEEVKYTENEVLFMEAIKECEYGN